MAEDIKYFPVNWIEGMKINKNHFIELHDNVEDLIRDARNININVLNYGLLSSPFSKPFQYTVTIDAHNELSVDIKSLKAITPAGGRIEITDYTGAFTDKIELKNFDFTENTYYLLLNVDPHQRIQSGAQNMEEVPPRFPHTTPKYFLSTINESEVNQNNIGAMQFPIAKFRTLTDGFEILTDYIPPSLEVKNHEILVGLFETYDMFFKQIEFNSVQIIKKIKFRNSTEDENVIAAMVREACEKSLTFSELQITNNKWQNVNVKPSEVLNNIVSFARVLKNCFDTFAGDGKEMLFNYFSEWTEHKSGEYERIFTDTINIKYRFFDVKETLDQAIKFMNHINTLFALLNQLDYIGRKKDTGIFVNENVLKNEKLGSSLFGSDSEKSNTNPPSSPSFLAD